MEMPRESRNPLSELRGGRNGRVARDLAFSPWRRAESVSCARKRTSGRCVWERERERTRKSRPPPNTRRLGTRTQGTLRLGSLERAPRIPLERRAPRAILAISISPDPSVEFLTAPARDPSATPTDDESDDGRKQTPVRGAQCWSITSKSTVRT